MNISIIVTNWNYYNAHSIAKIYLKTIQAL
jgi:hypothetical protein